MRTAHPNQVAAATRHGLLNATAFVERINRWRLANPEKLEKINERRKARIVEIRPLMLEGWKKSPRCQKGPNYYTSKGWALKDARGFCYEFTNVTHFILQNPHLFDELDVQWRPRKPGQTALFCRAQIGLGSLRPTRKRSTLTWKGWSWWLKGGFGV
jgi:hypothetical protein